jgi:hypothetical protein
LKSFVEPYRLILSRILPITSSFKSAETTPDEKDVPVRVRLGENKLA